MEKQKKREIKNSNIKNFNNINLLKNNCNLNNTKQYIKNSKGITLIALVVSIIVMMVLAGVSINATIGDNGIIRKTKLASIQNKYAQYKEELEMEMFGYYDLKTGEKSEITVTKSLMKNYIKSMKDEDLEKFAIVQGKLCYIGENEEEKEIAAAVGIDATRWKCRRCNGNNKCIWPSR